MAYAPALEEICDLLTRWHRGNRPLPISGSWEFQNLLQSVFNHSAYPRYHEHAWFSIAEEWSSELYCNIQTFSPVCELPLRVAQDAKAPIAAEVSIAFNQIDDKDPFVADDFFQRERNICRAFLLIAWHRFLVEIFAILTSFTGMKTLLRLALHQRYRPNSMRTQQGFALPHL